MSRRKGSQAGSVRTGILAGCAAALTIMVVGAGSCGYLIFRSVRMSEAYRMAVEELHRSPAAREALGEPIAEGLLTTGSVGVTNDDGEAKLAIPVSGPKGEGKLHVEAVKKGGPWTMTLLRLDPPSGERIDLLPAYELASLERGCAASRAEDCNVLGVRLVSGKDGRWGSPTEENAAVAIRSWGRACDLGSRDACSNLGMLYEGGRGVATDASRAIALYGRACDGGHLPGCANLGSLYLGLAGVPEDLPRAVPLLERACAGKVPLACSNLGWLHQHGRGVTKDLARAAALYGQGCDGGYPRGCVNLAELHMRGLGVPQDKERATALVFRACKAGDTLACEHMGLGSGFK